MRKFGLFSLILACFLALGLVFTACKDPEPEPTPAPVITTYTVTFDANGGSGTAPSAQIVIAGSGITLPNNNGLSKSDVSFEGWNTNNLGTGNNYSAGDSIRQLRASLCMQGG